MSLPTVPKISITIGITAADWRSISHEIDYLLSRAKDLQDEGRLPYVKEGDTEAMWVTRNLSGIRIREASLCMVPDERTPGSSGYGNYGPPAHYIARPEPPQT